MQRAALGISLLFNLWLVAFIILTDRTPAPLPSVTRESVTPQSAAPASEQPPLIQPPPPPAPQASGSNLIWPSEDFTHANWGPLENARIEANSDLSPRGIKTAARMVEDTATGRHRIEGKANGLRPGVTYTLSLYVKPAGRTALILELLDRRSGGKFGTTWFDVQKHRVLLQRGDTANAGIDAATNGFVRCWTVMPLDTDEAHFSFAILGPPNLAPSYPGDDTSGLLIWGAQLEPGAHPAPYLPTTDEPTLPQ